MKTFQDMQLPEALNRALQHMQFSEPTPIQAQAIPVALEGKDILGSAQTGTGKTAAFGIPVIAKILTNPESVGLIMTPTRELATQVMKQIQTLLGKKSEIQLALLIGGDPIPRQVSQLLRNPRIIIGTPGRINDHLKRGNLKLGNVDLLVLDETDRMLDMGFSSQIETIMNHMGEKKRQTLLFSATLPKETVRISEKYLNHPVHISIGTTSTPASKIKQDISHLQESEKYPHLLSELNERNGSIIVFVKTKYSSQKMAAKLAKAGHSADSIHGDLRQNKRDRVIDSFRKKKYRILVATDIAARGLDIPHIEHVINYDLPQCAQDYIHRIGRTARAGATGSALNFVTPTDRRKWSAIDRLLNPKSHQASSRADNESQNPVKKKSNRYNPKPDRPKRDQKPHTRGVRKSGS